MNSKDGEKARPIDSIEDVLNWGEYSKKVDARCQGKVPLPKDMNDVEGPKLLVCHDIQGGYGDDSLLDGGEDADHFTITHWHLIDIFVYFSHHLVTIPPPGWIDCAHTHGVKVLGTFITEWEEGRKICEELFSSPEMAEFLAYQLKEIALWYKFDGWLVNIENALPSYLIPNLVHFQRCLHEQMHRSDSRFLVFWYDAITIEGELKWQNSLTPENQPFLDVCDGLFVNYHWKEATPRQIAQQTGGRKSEIFMGIDCFGRGTFGGGGFDSHKAMEIAYQEGLSVALFAPGWVFERAEPLGTWKDRSRQFWNLLDTCHHKFRKPRPAIVKLPFQSNFCNGCGTKNLVQGVQGKCSWYKLSEQQAQPVCQDSLYVQNAELAFSLNSDEKDVWLSAKLENGNTDFGQSHVSIEGKLAIGVVMKVPFLSMKIQNLPSALSCSLLVKDLIGGFCITPCICTEGQPQISISTELASNEKSFLYIPEQEGDSTSAKSDNNGVDSENFKILRFFLNIIRSHRSEAINLSLLVSSRRPNHKIHAILGEVSLQQG